jgi:hypothetical protein
MTIQHVYLKVYVYVLCGAIHCWGEVRLNILCVSEAGFWGSLFENLGECATYLHHICLFIGMYRNILTVTEQTAMKFHTGELY